MLRDYEILFIVRPDLDEDALGAAVKSVETLIANLGGELQKTDVWGRRRLAYEVSHLREGQYVLTDFRLDPARVPEMEASLRISETVFRHLVVRKPDKVNGTAAARTAATPPVAEAAAAVVADELEEPAVPAGADAVAEEEEEA